MTHATTRTRVLLVILMALGLVLGSMAAPAAATSDDDGGGVDTVRSKTLGTIDYKIGLLTDLKNGTDNGDRKAFYDGGIVQLRDLRGSAEASSDIEKLRAMDAQAHTIYHETKAQASSVGQTDEEKITETRRATLDTINYKLGYFSDALAKTIDPAHKEIYQRAVASLKELKAAAEASSDVEYLQTLKAKAHEIYDTTKRLIADAGGGKTEAEKAAVDKAAAEKAAAEKAAEALAKARRSTLRLIEYKVSIFTHAAEAAKNPVVAGVYADAAATIADLVGDAKKATSVKALRKIDAQVMEIYEATKQTIADAHGDPAWEPSDTMLAHFQSLGSEIDRFVRVAEATAVQSPKTAVALSTARAKVTTAIDEVVAVAETGKDLDDRWKELRLSVNGFRRAFVVHFVAVTGGPGCIGGWYVPG